jgi:hypothetical protein
VDVASGTFSSQDNEALLAGGNPLAIEAAPGIWEIVQFGTAALQSPGRWKGQLQVQGIGRRDC